MPVEDRRLVFTNAEVYKAVYGLCIQREIKIPPSGVLDVIVEGPEGSDLIQLNIVTPHETANKEIKLEYRRDFIAAALMVFCRGLGIPLPKSSRKSVMIREGKMILRVQI